MTYSQYPAYGASYQNVSYSANYAPQVAVEPPLDQPWYEADFVGAFKRFWKKYAVFSGRASRSEYWFVFLANILISIIACITIIGIFILPFYSIAIIIPTLAITVRRLHDSNLSGGWLFLPIGLSLCASMAASFIPFTIKWGIFDNFEEFIDYYKIYEHYYDDNAFIDFIDFAAANIEFTAATIALIIASSLLSLMGSVISLVLMVRAPRREGARFDIAPAYQSYTAAPNYVANQQDFTYQATTPAQPMPYSTATPTPPTTNP